MTSMWHTLAEQWQNEETSFKELVIEASVEGQLDELENYLQSHSDERQPDISPASLEALEGYSLRCAYEFFLLNNVDKGAEIIAGVKGTQNANEWLKDALLTTLDPSVRSSIAEFLKSKGQLDDSEEQMMSNINRLSTMYPCSEFSTAISNFEQMEGGGNVSLSSLETALKAHVKNADLNSDVEGVVSCEGRENLWAGVLVKPLSTGAEGSFPGMAESSSGGHGESLFMRVAVNWVQNVEQDTLGALRFEAKVLSGQAGPGDLDGTSWTVAFQYHMTHHMVEEALETVEKLPDSFTRKADLQVFEDGEEVLRQGIDVVSVDMSTCSSALLHQVLEDKFLSKGLVLNTKWSVEDWLRLLARTGLLLATTEAPLGLVPLLKSEAMAQMVVRFCAKRNLPHILQHYLEGQSISVDMGTTLSLLKSAKDSSWAQWLILSRVPNQSFAASIANARSISESEIHSVSDIAENGSIFMALSSLADSPAPLKECLRLKMSGVDGDRGASDGPGEVEICSASPRCNAEAIGDPSDDFPDTRRAVLALARSFNSTGNVSRPDYFSWRSTMFGDQVSDLGFLDLIPKAEDADFHKLVAMSIGKFEQLEGSTGGTAGFWEGEALKHVDEWVSTVASPDFERSTVLGVCYHLMNGHAMAALHWFLANKDVQLKSPDDIKKLESGDLGLGEKDLSLLARVTRVVGVQCWAKATVVSACLMLASACGLPTTVLKIDVTSLQKIQQNLQEGQEVDVRSLGIELAKEVAKQLDSASENTGPTAQRVLDLLEGVLIGESVVRPPPPKPQQSRRRHGSMESLELMTKDADPNHDLMIHWSLVHAFAALHNLKTSGKLLEELAARDDWILFLAESGAHNYGFEQVMSIAGSKFSNPKIGYHVCHILRQHGAGPDASRKEAEMRGLEMSEAPESKELFGIMVEAERTGQPGQALLKWARSLCWQMLTVVAACYADVSVLDCLLAWLEIRALKHTRTPSSDQPLPEDNTDKLIYYVETFCMNDRFKDLLDGVSLFPVVSGSGLCSFIEGLKAFKEHVFPVAEAKLQEFQESVEGLQKGGEAGGSKPNGVPGRNGADGSVTPTDQSSSSSVRDLKALDKLSDVELVDRVSHTAAISVLQALPSIYEREKLLEMLVELKTQDGCTWPEDLKVFRVAYRLLGEDAEQYISWSHTGSTIADAEEVMGKLQAKGNWMEAREWGTRTKADMNDITRKQVGALVQEWDDLGLNDDLFEILWDEVNEIFLEHKYPAFGAGVFFVRLAVQCKSRISQQEVRQLLLCALSWLQGEKTGSAVASASKLVSELRRVLCLMDPDPEKLAETNPNKGFTATGGRYDRSPQVQMVLKPALKQDSNRQSSENTAAVASTSAFFASKSTGKSGVGHASEEDEELLAEAKQLLLQLMDKPSQTQLEKTVRSLLDGGEVQAAKELGKELPTPPVDFYLVDNALAIIHKCGASGWSGTSVEGVVMDAILKFLRKKHYISLEGPAPPPQAALEAIALACAEGGGKAVCHRCAVTFKASTLLNMSCQELAALGPYQILELLLVKGEMALGAAREFGAAFEFTPRATAKLLAQMLLKGLLDDSTGTKKLLLADQGDLDRRTSCEELVTNAVICSDWTEVGNALMQLLLERHSGLPCSVEAEILSLAYQCYNKCEYVEGLDVLLELATSRAGDYAAEKNYEALSKLVIGLGKYETLRNGLDLVVRNNQLDMLLKEGGEESKKSRVLQAAILSAIHRQRPDDHNALSLVHQHFNMHAEVAQGLKTQATELLQQFSARGYPGRDPTLIQAIDHLINAAEEYSSVECSLAAARCGALVALVAQQACFPERHWVCLDDGACRDLLPHLPELSHALVVSRAYNFNTPQDWVLTLWQHMLEMASQANRGTSVFSAALNQAVSGMQAYARGALKEIAMTEEHIEQIVQMFMFHQEQNAAYGDGTVNSAVLTKCMAQFLRSIPDYEHRLQLCQTVSGKEFEPLVKECLSLLDIEHPPLMDAISGSE